MEFPSLLWMMHAGCNTPAKFTPLHPHPDPSCNPKKYVLLNGPWDFLSHCCSTLFQLPLSFFSSPQSAFVRLRSLSCVWNHDAPSEFCILWVFPHHPACLPVTCLPSIPDFTDSLFASFLPLITRPLSHHLKLPEHQTLHTFLPLCYRVPKPLNLLSILILV